MFVLDLGSHLFKHFTALFSIVSLHDVSPETVVPQCHCHPAWMDSVCDMPTLCLMVVSILGIHPINCTI